MERRECRSFLMGKIMRSRQTRFQKTDKHPDIADHIARRDVESSNDLDIWFTIQYEGFRQYFYVNDILEAVA